MAAVVFVAIMANIKKRHCSTNHSDKYESRMGQLPDKKWCSEKISKHAAR